MFFSQKCVLILGLSSFSLGQGSGGMTAVNFVGSSLYHDF